jgi:predicted O-methyltransferase YrrM
MWLRARFEFGFVTASSHHSAVLLGVIAASIACGIDLRRRHLSIVGVLRDDLLTILDVASVAALCGVIVSSLLGLDPLFFAGAANENSPRSFITVVALLVIATFAWREGAKQVQFQRPDGIVLGECLVLVGAYELFESWVASAFHRNQANAGIEATSAGCIVAGAMLIAVIVPRFLKRREEHRIIERVSSQGEAIQAEYTPATDECPHPERWKMLDSMTAEVEVLNFLKSLVMTVKPELVVETGTFMGLSAIKMAEGMRENGFGRIITCEFDPVVFQKAKERIAASGLAEWIECRNESSLDMKVDGTIDIFFSDSDIPIREKEIRKFLPQVNANGIVLTHDASSHYKIVREAALRLEAEGLLSVVLVATPRGLVIAQKRSGRK